MLKKLVTVNKALKEKKLVIFTWGNASCRVEKDKIFIKPSGVPFEDLREKDLSKIDLSTGKHIAGLNPSVDTPTHVVLYNAFPEINAIIHTHSKYSTIFAQAKMAIPCVGTTHSDYFYGNIPVVDDLNVDEINHDYEKNIGLKIVQYFHYNKIIPLNMQAALSPSHGAFIWGQTLEKALKNAIILETVAEMAYKTLQLCYNKPIDFDINLLNKHFLRKHGDNKYYGQ